MKSSYLVVFVAACAMSLLVSQASSHPLQTQISDKDRQELIQAARQIMKIVLRGELPPLHKRNPGAIDAILGMPDLNSIGRK